MGSTESLRGSNRHTTPAQGPWVNLRTQSAKQVFVVRSWGNLPRAQKVIPSRGLSLAPVVCRELISGGDPDSVPYDHEEQFGSQKDSGAFPASQWYCRARCPAGCPHTKKNIVTQQGVHPWPFPFGSWLYSRQVQQPEQVRGRRPPIVESKRLQSRPLVAHRFSPRLHTLLDTSGVLLQRGAITEACHLSLPGIDPEVVAAKQPAFSTKQKQQHTHTQNQTTPFFVCYVCGSSHASAVDAIAHR